MSIRYLFLYKQNEKDNQAQKGNYLIYPNKCENLIIKLTLKNQQKDIKKFPSHLFIIWHQINWEKCSASNSH